MKKKISEIITGYLLKHAGEEQKIEEFSDFLFYFSQHIDISGFIFNILSNNRANTAKTQLLLAKKGRT